MKVPLSFAPKTSSLFDISKISLFVSTFTDRESVGTSLKDCVVFSFAATALADRSITNTKRRHINFDLNFTIFSPFKVKNHIIKMVYFLFKELKKIILKN